ncbi:MAG: ABC transporter permease [Betaproteobacteria bacterium]|jgi:peptide/nickel transport system permease protein|nr:ABC transporter permease [Pseudomonadota bacterium]NBO03761.1 ABC transporter permease [Betaproteobacteria bacterium]NBP34096.1 ABC transporter permease [Betaproteobacteria bacterium]NBP38580.1 ABC transporter permease [Betaproteobacteria bacterium]NBQ78165.1 ABC transporter permease [Betaproteobacteria bacterium]
MKLALLPTDWLIWAVVLVTLVWSIRMRAHPMLMENWRKVFLKPSAMVSGLVLASFVCIALLDSMRWVDPSRPGDNALSALDRALAPLVQARERRYSAPLAYVSFRKESMERDGQTVRDYPRLQFGGAQLQNPQTEWFGDVLERSAKALVKGLAAVLVLGLLLRWLFRQSPYPWPWAFAAGSLLLLLACWAVELSAAYHVLGTDRTGNSVLWIALKSIRTALVIGVLTTLVVLPLALGLGVIAGYFRGWIDEVIQYLYTLLSSIPDVLLIAAAVLLLQVTIDNHPELFATALERSDARLLFLCLILGLTAFTGLCRLVRGEAMKLRELEYIQAARAFGVSSFGIISKHIVPNLMHIVLISMVMQFSGFVLAEAVLSYVGVGVDPKTQSFGVMINAARAELAATPVVWWTLTTAFIFMLMLVLSANLFSDAVRDAFDPRARQKA